jgi:hypothetical protein
MAKRAVIAVHGIGQHQPYEMALSLAQGLVSTAEERGIGAGFGQIVPSPEPRGAAPAGRIYRVATSADPNSWVDIYEAYWAPLTAGLTSFLGIVWWLFFNTFIPSRMLSRPNGKGLFDVGVSALTLAAIGAAYYLLFGAFLQTTSAVAGATALSDASGGVGRSFAALAVPSGAASGYSPHLSVDFGRGLAGTAASWRILSGAPAAPSRLPLGILSIGTLGRILSPVTLVWLLATAVGVYALLQFVYRLGEVAADLSRILDHALGNLIILAASAAVYLLALGSVTPEFFTYGYVYLAFRLVNLSVKKYFVDYVGDIEVYVTRDSKSARFTAREAIRGRAVDAVLAALTSPEDYDEVLVFGHSLGSVVGLDALREVRRQAGSALAFEDFRRLSAFVTFGSPLEKTRFFFDRISPRDGGPWSQFLQDVQQTFVVQIPRPAGVPPAMPSARRAGASAAAPTQQHRVRWFNYWYFADVIANSLDSYNDAWPDLVQTVRLPQPGPSPWVHLTYFVDPHFRGPVYDMLFGHAG